MVEYLSWVGGVGGRVREVEFRREIDPEKCSRIRDKALGSLLTGFDRNPVPDMD